MLQYEVSDFDATFLNDCCQPTESDTIHYCIMTCKIHVGIEMQHLKNSNKLDIVASCGSTFNICALYVDFPRLDLSG